MADDADEFFAERLVITEGRLVRAALGELRQTLYFDALKACSDPRGEALMRAMRQIDRGWRDF